MKMMPSALHLVRRSIGVGIIAMVCGQAFAVGVQDRSEKLRRFEADSQACRSGKSAQNFDTCMKEAKAVLAERAGSNPTVSTEQLQRNALLRCDALTGDEYTACAARMRGEGMVSGSVAGGGILREIVITEVVPLDSKTPVSADAEK